MSYTDYAKQIWEMYEKEMSSRKNADYEVTPEQMQKLIDAYGFFMEVAASGNGKVEPFKIVPKEVNGGITAYFSVFYLSGDDIQRFCKVVSSFSALSIDSLKDGTVCLSFTVPRVFKRK